MKKVLIYLNTYYHVETLLSIYSSFINVNCEPFIFFEDQDNVLGLKELCKKYELNLIEESSFNNIDLNNFYLHVIITGFVMPLENKLPPGNPDILELLMNRNTLMIYHRAEYLEDYQYHQNFFKKSNALSVAPFSQKHNLNFIYQTDNIITKKIALKKSLSQNSPITFLFLTRFDMNQNRMYQYIDEIQLCDNLLNKQVEINFIGSGPDYSKFATKKVIRYKNLKNIFFKIDFDLSEIDFYEKINNSDFIFNAIDYNLIQYYYSKFTSNINHIIAFEKPNISNLFLSNIYNMPGYTFLTAQNFREFFSKKINELTDDKYKTMCNNFDILKNNMYNHNNFILNKILYNL